MVTLLAYGRVIVPGGCSTGGAAAGAELSDPEISDGGTGRFSPGPRSLSGRYRVLDAVTALPCGGVLVAGGAPVPESYDPADHVVIPLRGELGGPQMFAAAPTRRRTREVVVLGGYDPRIQSSTSAWMLGSSRCFAPPAA